MFGQDPASDCSHIRRGSSYMALGFVLLAALCLLIECFPLPELRSWHTVKEESVSLSSESAFYGTGTRIYQSTLPEDAAEKLLILRCENLNIRIWVHGSLIYASQPSIFGSCPGDHLLVVSLPKDAGGSVLQLECSSVSAFFTTPIHHVYYGSADMLIPQFMLRSVPGMLIGGALLFAGMLILYISEMMLQAKRRLHRPLTWLGLFITALSVWCFTQLDVVLLSGIPSVIIQFLSYGSPALAASGLFFYLSDEVHDGKWSWFCLAMGRFSLAWIGVVFLLDISFLLPYFYTVYFTYALLLCCGGGALIHLIAPLRHHLPVGYMLVGYVLLSAGAALDLLRTLLMIPADHALFTRAGLLALVLGTAADSARQAISSIQRAATTDTLQQAAYLDALTGVYNRRAYERDTAALIDSETRVGVVMLDINNLKHANDAYGHEQGDALIRAAARVIGQAFTGFGTCYRYGGDEFVVLVTAQPEVHCPAGIGSIGRLCLAENRDRQGHQPPLGIASGWAIYLPGHEGSSFANTQRMADSHMYETKRAMKAQCSCGEGDGRN